MAFSHNHLFIALSEQTINNIILDLEGFIDEWNDQYEKYCDKKDYEKLLVKIKHFYRNYFLTSSQLIENGEQDSAWSLLEELLEKLKTNKKSA